MAPRAPRSDRERQLVLRTISLLRRISAATNEWQRTSMEEGLTVNQALALHHLAKHGDATPGELAEWMQVTRGTMTPTIQRLEELGLVTRRVDATDGRKQWLTATAEAHEIVDEVDDKVLHPIFAAFAGWSPRELETFCEDLSRVLASPLFGGKP